MDDCQHTQKLCLRSYRMKSSAMDLTNRHYLCNESFVNEMNSSKMNSNQPASDNEATSNIKHHQHQDDSSTSKKVAANEVYLSKQLGTAATIESTGKENHHDHTNQPPSFINQEKQQEQSHQEQEKEKEQEQQQQRCYECNKSLTKSKHLVSISGQENQWHSECFKCNICSKLMDEEMSCHMYKDKIICREDYLKLQRDLTIKCSRCHWPICASDWVRRASHYVYHLACFSCDICQRQLSTGEQFTIRVQQKKNVVRLLCRLHFAINQAGKVQQQGMKINGSMLSRGMNLDEIDHDESNENDVTTIQTDKQTAETTRCTTNHHHQQQQQHRIFMNEQTSADSNYLHLLAASTSQQAIIGAATSDERSFSLQDEEQQQQHSNILLGDSSSARLLFKLDDQFQTDIDLSNLPHHHHHHHNNQHQHQHHQHLQLQNNIQQHQQRHNSTALSIASSESSSISGNGGGGNSSASCHNLASLASKSKRVRTTFTEDQLSILQNYFQRDSNPDGQDLERIATITGLTKRVTQVWFQNSRARQKKYMTKRKPNGTCNNLVQQQAANCSTPNQTQSSDGISISSQKYHLNSQHQQQLSIDPSISGECFAKMNLNTTASSAEAAAVAHQKWTVDHMVPSDRDNTMSSSISSSQDDMISHHDVEEDEDEDEEEDDDLDESRFASRIDDQDDGAALRT